MKISSGRLFALHFHLVGVGLIVVAGVLLSINIFLAIGVALVSGLIFTGSSGFAIDKDSKKYREYYSFFFVEFGDWDKYNGLDLIFINSSKVTQKVYAPQTSQSATFEHREFNGYLKLSSGTKVHILSTKNKEKLMKQLNDLAYYLSIEVVDYTN